MLYWTVGSSTLAEQHVSLDWRSYSITSKKTAMDISIDQAFSEGINTLIDRRGRHEEPEVYPLPPSWLQPSLG